MARSTQHQWHSFARPSSRRPGQRRPIKRQPFQRRLRIEQLEDRRLLAVVTVTTVADTVNLNDGVTSLREAIFATNLVAGADTINFAASLTSGGPATIQLTQGELKITDALAINGPGANLLTIDASGNDPTPDVNNGDGSRVFNIEVSSVFSFDHGAAAKRSVLITGVTLTGGDVGSAGGAISTRAGGAELTVAESTISGNSSGGWGGGISGGDVTIINSTISGNSARYGGGIATAAEVGSLTVTGSTISGNSAAGDGGGIIGLSLTVIDSTISDNSAGDDGGGISGAYGAFSSGSLTVTNTTISGNSADGSGGGIFNNSGNNLTVSRSTISGNSAGLNGGGIQGVVRATLNHTIVAGNTRGALEANDISGSVTIAFSLLGVDTGVTITNNGGNLIGTAAAPIDPLLGPLANNGGPTKTHALLPGSAAINAGDLSAVAGMGGVPVSDQRGAPFGRIFNGRIDIGAFEYQKASNLNLVVDTLADESDGNYALGNLSLREAILLANRYPSIDTINFSPSLTTGGPATILLTHGELKITDSLTINGPGANLLTIDASGNDPTPNSTYVDGKKSADDGDGSRIFNIDDGISSNLLNASISGLTLSGGDGIGSGGAISAFGENLAVSDCVITGNSGGSGGGINGGGPISSRLHANLTVTNSVVSGNFAYYSGGGISSPYLTITGSTVSGNSADRGGGGIISSALNCVSTTISGNSAGGSGGGILGLNHSNFTVVDSEVSGNSSKIDGGGIYGDTITVSGGTISGNSASSGGGIFHEAGFPSPTTVSITDSQINDNKATGNSNSNGGGIWSLTGKLTVTRSTISGNFANNNGGGIWDGSRSNLIYNDLTIIDSTISGNMAESGGGGIAIATAGNLSITGSTISHNVSNGVIKNNYSLQSGGGIWCQTKATTISSSTFSGNSSGFGGGAISSTPSVSISVMSIADSIFERNTAKGDGHSGGAILKSGGGMLTVDHSQILNNTAGWKGGGIITGDDLTLTNSVVSDNAAYLIGGGIYGGNVTMTSSTISGNTAYDGGGICSRGNLAILNSEIGNNSAGPEGTNVILGRGRGGGIFGYFGKVSVTGSTISGNSATGGGGGIWNAGGSLMVAGSTISGNTAGGSALYPNGNGGGIFGGTVTVTTSTISGNSATGGGGIAGNDVTVTNSTISGNTAGGSALYPNGNGGGIFGGTVTVTTSTISGNLAVNGGGAIFGYLVTVADSTISGNSAATGGGLFTDGTTTVRRSTIAFNTTTGVGKGIFVNNGSLLLDHSIVAQNTGPNGDINGLLGTTITAQFSLVGYNQGSGLAPAPVGAPDIDGNLIGTPSVSSMIINPLLGPLADNGGPTFTHALLPDSPAIDAGDPAAVAGMGGVPEFDQRGAPWSRVVGGRIDMGAVESQPNPLPGDYNFDGLVDTADYCVWRDTLGSTTDLRADGDASGLVDQPDYDQWRADFGNTLPVPVSVGSMLSTVASNGEAAAARCAAADKASPITASAQAVDRALTELGGGMPVRGSERFTLAVHADRRMAAQQADANLLLLAVARSAPPGADADFRLDALAHGQELDAARQFERWSEVGVEWDVGSSRLSQQLVNA